MGRRRPHHFCRHRLLGRIHSAAARHPPPHWPGRRPSRLSCASLDGRVARRCCRSRLAHRSRPARADSSRVFRPRPLWPHLLRRGPRLEIARSAIHGRHARPPLWRKVGSQAFQGNSGKFSMTTVYIALGTNVGDRDHNLREAVRLLKDAGIRILKVSSIYETEPVDYLEQPWFLNAALEAQSNLAPIELLHKLRGIESAMGSKKPFAKGPRLIDLDILLYGNEMITTPELQVPHPRMLDRRFVLAPLVEIAPNLRHPQWPATASQLLAVLKDPGVVRLHSSRHDISRPTGRG